MTVDTLIDQLSNELKPVRPMTTRRLGKIALFSFAGVFVCIMIVLGLRPDYRDALASGSLFWKPMIFALSAVSVVYLLATSSLPGRRISRLSIIPFGLAMMFLVILLVHAIWSFDADVVKTAMTDKRAPWCLGVVSVMGMAVFGILWRFWLRNSAPEYRGRAGFYAGVCAGFVASSAYAFHCGQDHPFYITLYYGVPIVMLGLVGAWITKKYHSW